MVQALLPTDLSRIRAGLAQRLQAARQARWRWEDAQLAAELARTRCDVLACTDTEGMRRYPHLSFLDPYFLAGATPSALVSALLVQGLQYTGAHAGNVQLYEPNTGVLHIAAQAGFDQPFLTFFAHVGTSGSACAEAASRGREVIVPDIRRSSLFDDASRQAMLDAHCLTVRSHSLLGPANECLGVFSLHHPRSNGLHDVDVQLLTTLVRAAGRALAHHTATPALVGWEDADSNGARTEEERTRLDGMPIEDPGNDQDQGGDDE
ncbi:hypothetical protein C3486_26830 [Streptomyces sp. Ru73]|uniref:GAF domain-containing protein n=1 Tax=Streptomyces sp. Ru73 TaxID=2080748 RepID=UPI000CDD092C|nr:GAF domain-containing protein [Streptomyces sp. Ru73]POX37709.1 hypothetical protein C3486_26830 [Streptomyces sp. Ru73]